MADWNRYKTRFSGMGNAFLSIKQLIYELS